MDVPAYMRTHDIFLIRRRKYGWLWLIDTYASMLPEGLDQQSLRKVLFTVIITVVNRAEVCNRALNVGSVICQLTLLACKLTSLYLTYFL